MVCRCGLCFAEGYAVRESLDAVEKTVPDGWHMFTYRVGMEPLSSVLCCSKCISALKENLTSLLSFSLNVVAGTMMPSQISAHQQTSAEIIGLESRLLAASGVSKCLTQ